MRTEIGILLLLTASSCSTPSHPSAAPAAAPDRIASSVEILYTRGHNQHRLFASLDGDKAVAQSYLDRQILAESAVDRANYFDFVKKASEFLKGNKQTADRFPCRTPFTVTVRQGGETRAASGCLTPDEGALSHLVRDGEFLLQRGVTR
jgi:hypothetical protein